MMPVFASPLAQPAPGRRDVLITTVLIVMMTLWHVALLRVDVPWQDDDAFQYMSHARNIALQRPYADTGYIFTARTAEIGPQRYPPGLPLLLAPIYLGFGFDSLKPYMVAGLLTTAAMLVVLGAWCRNGRPAVSSPAIVAILLVSPEFTRASELIIAEPLYLLFAMLGLYVVDRDDMRGGDTAMGSAVLAGLLIGLASITRTLGVALVLAILLQTAVRLGRGWQRAAVSVATSLVLSALGGLLTGGSAATDYSSGFWNYDWSTPFRNVRLYAGDLALEFLVPIPGATGLGKIALLVFLGLIGIGVMKIWRERNGPTVWECFVAWYLAIVLVWPFYQGIRFMLPILPWAVRTAWIGLTDASNRLTGRAAPLVRGLATAMILLLSVPGLAAELRAANTPYPDGLSSPNVQEFLEFVTSRTDARARLIATRPRTIAMVTGRAVAGWPRDVDARILFEHIREVGATHLVIDRWTSRDAPIEQLIGQPDFTFERVFSNERFTVFETAVTR